jgi:hypothetical protein
MNSNSKNLNHYMTDSDGHASGRFAVSQLYQESKLAGSMAELQTYLPPNRV